MTKLQNFDLTSVIQNVSKFSPVALTTCAALSFIAVGIFCVDYYESLFVVRFGDNARNMAILVAVIQEAVRFALLISSVRDFTDEKRFNGWLGLFGSGLLVWHDMGLAVDVANMWDTSNADAYTGIFYFLILIGLLLEIRIVLTVGESEDLKSKPMTSSGKKLKSVSV